MFMRASRFHPLSRRILEPRKNLRKIFPEKKIQTYSSQETKNEDRLPLRILERNGLGCGPKMRTTTESRQSWRTFSPPIVGEEPRSLQEFRIQGPRPLIQTSNESVPRMTGVVPWQVETCDRPQLTMVTQPLIGPRGLIVTHTADNPVIWPEHE